MAYEVTDGSATQTHDWHQRAQNSRQKRRSENEVAGQLLRRAVRAVEVSWNQL